MPKYVFAYHGGGMPETPEAGAKAMKAWEDWFKALGSGVVDAGNPVGRSRTVSAQGVSGDGGANPVSGYSVLDAPDFDAAVDMAKGCPMVADGSGSVEVAEVIDM